MTAKIMVYFGEEKYEVALTSISWFCKENKKIVIPNDVTLLELSHVNLFSFNRIELENSDTWLLLDHCYFEGTIVSGNVSLYPNGNRKDESISFMDNQEVEIIFPENQRKQRKRSVTYGFHHVKNLIVQGNAASSNFISLSSMNEFGVEHVTFSQVDGGNIKWMTIRNMEVVDSILGTFHLAKGEKLRIINSDILSCEKMPLDPIQMDLFADEVELINSRLYSQAFHFKNFMIQDPLISHDEKTETKRKKGEHQFQALLFRDDCSNKNGNLAIARAKLVCDMQVILIEAKNRLEQTKEENKKIIVGTYSIPLNKLKEWISKYLPLLEEAEIKKDTILLEMNSEIEKNNNQVDLFPIGRVLKKGETEEKA